MLSTPWLAMALLAGASATAGGVMLVSGHASATRADPAHPQHGYREAVLSLDDYIEAATARTTADPRSWLVPEGLAQGYRRRAQLTGDYIDYTRARESLELSFATAPPGAGPFLARAQLNATMHCWDRIEPDLVKVEHSWPKSFERAAVQTLRGERAFQSGLYDESLKDYHQALDLEHGPIRYFSLAAAENALGDHAGADALLDQAERLQPRRDFFTAAWLQLERGIILQDRGELDLAHERFLKAESIMPGWWRVEGREADVLVLRGEVADALPLYQDLVKKTSNPEFMDDLARWSKDASEREHYRAMARAVYDSEITEYPEAACAHALDHFLDLEHEPELTVKLALMNYHLRPGGEASTKLARAYLHAGRNQEARELITKVLADRWDMSLLHRTAQEIFTACHAPELAAAQGRLLSAH
jgi:tetratricopeptide (TPR) repeat protein